MSNNTMQQAAVIIQKYFRAYEVRKKYTVRDLEKNEKTSYNATIIGNDPYISNALDSYKTEQKIAFISVSSMRIVDIACQITSDTKHTPKIIVIDNSSKVSNLWRNIRAFSEKNNTSAENFLKVLPALLNDNREFFLEKSFNYIASQRTDYIPIVKRGEILRFNANAITFFKYLFEKYSFEKVMKIILGATVICQSWTDTNTLVSVKNVLNSIGIEKIYMYPSNLVACFGDDKEIQMEILENIKKIDPFITLHTDRVFAETTSTSSIAFPENFYIFEEQDPKNVLYTIKKLNSKEPNTSKPDTLAKNKNTELFKYGDNISKKLNNKQSHLSSATFFQTNKQQPPPKSIENGFSPKKIRLFGSCCIC